MQLSPQERRVVDAVAARRDALVALTSELVGLRHRHPHARRGARARSARCRSTWPACCARTAPTSSLHEPDAASLRPHPMVPDELTFDGPPAARRALPRQRRRTHAAAQRPRRRRRRRAARRLDAAGPVRGRDPRRPALRPRGVRHEGRRREHGHGRLHPRRARRAAGGRPHRQHGHRGGVDRRRRALRRAPARRPTRRSSPSRAASSCGSPAAAACCRASPCAGRAGHAGIHQLPPEQGGAVNAIEKMALVLDAVRRLREHWAQRPRHPYLSAGDCVPTIVAGGEWLVSYPAVVHARVPHRVPPGPRRRARLRRARRARVLRTGSPTPRRPTRGCASTRPRSSGASAACRRPRSPTDDPIVQTLLAAGGDLGQLAAARRPRQLARRRHAHGRGRHPGRLLRPGRRPPRPHGRRVRADRRPRRLRPAHRADGDALLRLSRGVHDGVRHPHACRRRTMRLVGDRRRVRREVAARPRHQHDADADHDPDQREPPDLVEPVDRRRLVDDAVERRHRRRARRARRRTRARRGSPRAAP